MKCRSCESENLRPVISLGKIPLVNALLDSPEDPHEKFPLDMVFCYDCHLGQLVKIVPPEKMFSEYVFYSSVMEPVVERAKNLVGRFLPAEPGLVIEIASNDGYLLDFYRQAGISVLGIDPARGPANAAAVKGIPTIQAFFSLKLAKTLPKADIVHANNVLAHCPDINDIAAGIAEILKPNGICIIEVPYLGDLIQQCQFDTIYQEHIYYFSYQSLVRLFERHKLYIEDVEPLPDVLGGSLRLTVGKTETSYSFHEYGLEDIVSMQSKADTYAWNLKDALTKFKEEGKSVWGFGAAAKATVFLNYAKIDKSLITAIADGTPAKQGKYIPGTGIQVVNPDSWLREAPDITCIFTWNYANVISNKYYRRYNGEFITSRILSNNEEKI